MGLRPTLRACGEGYQPWCGKLRLGKGALTPAAEEISSLAGVLGSFADGAERVLRKMSGLRLSESTIERTTETAGERVAGQLAAGKSLGPAENWGWHHPMVDDALEIRHPIRPAPLQRRHDPLQTVHRCLRWCIPVPRPGFQCLRPEGATHRPNYRRPCILLIGHIIVTIYVAISWGFSRKFHW